MTPHRDRADHTDTARKPPVIDKRRGDVYNLYLKEWTYAGLGDSTAMSLKVTRKIGTLTTGLVFAEAPLPSRPGNGL